MVIKTDTLRDFYGKVLGTIELESNGNKTVRNFYGKVLGRYDKQKNVTTDFYGKILYRGDYSQLLFALDKR